MSGRSQLGNEHLGPEGGNLGSTLKHSLQLRQTIKLLGAYLNFLRILQQ